MLERDGNLKLVVSGRNDNSDIKPIVREHISEDAHIITDSSSNYVGLELEYAGHQTVNHSEYEFVKNKVIHINSIEGAFSMLKRT